MKANKSIGKVLTLSFIICHLSFSPVRAVSGTPLERVGEALSLMMAGHGIVVLSAPVAVQHLIS